MTANDRQAHVEARFLARYERAHDRHGMADARTRRAWDAAVRVTDRHIAREARRAPTPTPREETR